MEETCQKLNKNLLLYCTKFIYLALIAIPFVASFSSALVNIFIGFAIFAYFIKKIAKREFLPIKTVINIPFLFIIIISFISFFNSIDLKSSMGGIGKLIKYGFLFVIFAEELIDRQHLKKIIIALILGLTLVSLDGIYQLYVGKDLFRNRAYNYVIGLPRLNATFPHTNIFAAYLGLMLPINISLTLYYLKGKIKLLLGTISILALSCLVFTFSRGAIIGFLTSLVFMAIVKRDKLVLLLLIFVLLVTPFLLPKNIRNWIKTTDSVWEVLLNKERINIYKTSLNMIRAHPLIGVGVNTFCSNYQKYKIKETSGFTWDARYYAHNNFLHMSGEIGLFGLAVFLWLLFAFFRRWVIFFRNIGSNFLKICSLGVVAGIIAFLINGLTETTLYNSKVATLFWYQIGLFLGLSKLDKGVKE